MAESGMFVPAATPATVLCCICGVPMQPTPGNMCLQCVRSRHDITAGLPRESAVVFCPECSSYLVPPKAWVRAELDSQKLREILLRGLQRSQAFKKNGLLLTDAAFLFSEPHSKRIRLKIEVRKSDEVPGATIQQSHVIIYTVHYRLCDSCSRAQANPDQWTAVVQLRQHVAHRRTFLYLEQLILRHGIAATAVRVAATSRGIDFFFASKSQAQKLVDFVGSVVPVNYRSDKQLQSHDPKSNVFNFRYSFSVEICKVCRDDLVVLPPQVYSALGGLGPILLCTKVTGSITLLDPVTLRSSSLTAKQYFESNFTSYLSSRQLVEYIVLDIDPEPRRGGSPYQLAYAQIARVSDFGKNDNIFTVRTHLGHLLHPGDNALGYDLHSANANDGEVAKYNNLELPDAVLVKKSYEESRRSSKQKKRAWKLKRLQMDVDETIKGKGEIDKRDAEYEQFQRDLEENPELRFDINLYRDSDYQPSEMGSSVDGDALPSIPLEELINDLSLEDAEDGDDGGESSDDYMRE